MQRETHNLGSSGRVSRSLWLVLAALLLGGASLAYPRTLLDSPTSTYIGSIILEGGAPYRDAWEPRAPGIYFAYALQIFTLGKSTVALRLFDLLWQLATAFALASIGTRLYGQAAIGLTAGISYLVAYFSQNFWTWAEPDTFLSLPLALAFLFLLRGLGSHRVLDWFFAAAFTGVATLFKLPYGLFGLLLLGAAIHKSRNSSRDLIGHLLGLAAGFGAPLLACLAYFYAKGALEDFLTSQFVFAPAYLAQVHKVVGLRDFLESVLRPVLVPPAVMGFIGLGSWIARLRGPGKSQVAEFVLAGWLAVGLVSIFLHGSFLPYHYLSLFAPIAVLFAKALYQVAASFRTQRSRRSGLILLFVALSLVVPAEKLRQHTVFAWRVVNGHVPDAPLRELGEYIRQRTGPDETIFIWGNAPVVYLHAERRAAARFLCTSYLSVEAPGFDPHAIALRELEANAPTYFVLFRQGSITPGLPDSLTSLEGFPALKNLLVANYQIERDGELCTLFRRKPHR